MAGQLRARRTRWSIATNGAGGRSFIWTAFGLRSPEEAADLDWEGLLTEGDAILVEWPERAGAWLPCARSAIPALIFADLEWRGLEAL